MCDLSLCPANTCTTKVRTWIVRAVLPTPPSPSTTNLYKVILPAILGAVERQGSDCWKPIVVTKTTAAGAGIKISDCEGKAIAGWNAFRRVAILCGQGSIFRIAESFYVAERSYLSSSESRVMIFLAQFQINGLVQGPQSKAVM